MAEVFKHFVVFLSPGSFVSERSTHAIKEWDVEEAKEQARSIIERYGATPYAFYFMTRARNAEDLGVKAAATIPEDRFRVRIFCFDTKVYETSLASGKLYGFGGTSFQPIENAIQSIVQKEEKTKYPQRVFVITDGLGSSVSPEFPERWHWFITEGYSSTDYVPSKSRHYKLKDYE